MHRFCGVCVLLLSLGAHADDLKYQRALAFQHQGQNERALELFRASYKRHPTPATLYQIAESQRLLGQRSAAKASYEEYLMMVPDPPNRSEIEARINDLERPPAAVVTLAPLPPELTETVALEHKAPPRSKKWVWAPVIVSIAAVAAVGVGLGVHYATSTCGNCVDF
jgi:hypothetical protein